MVLGSFPLFPASDHDILPWLVSHIEIPVREAASPASPVYASWSCSLLPSWPWQASRFSLQEIIHSKMMRR